MSETPQERPRPTPRPRPAAGQRPSPTPRPRVAGSRRERDPEVGAERTARPAPAPAAGPAARPAAAPGATALRTGTAPAGTASQDTRPAGTASRGTASVAEPRRRRARVAAEDRPRRRRPVLALALAVLCLLVAAGGGVLLYQRLRPTSVDASVFQAARSGVEALYAFDYKDAEGSIQRKLAVLTGDLRGQYQKDLSQGGIVDTYKQVSATTSYDVVDVGLVQIDDAQDAATLVVFGQYVVKSANSGTQQAPQGSECTVTSDGAQSCTQTVQLHEVKVHGDWKIDDLSLKTTS